MFCLILLAQCSRLECELAHKSKTKAYRPFLHERHFSAASTGPPAPEPILEEIVSNRALQLAALVPARSDRMASRRKRPAVGDEYPGAQYKGPVVVNTVREDIGYPLQACYGRS